MNYGIGKRGKEATGAYEIRGTARHLNRNGRNVSYQDPDFTDPPKSWTDGNPILGFRCLGPKLLVPGTKDAPQGTVDQGETRREPGSQRIPQGYRVAKPSARNLLTKSDRDIRFLSNFFRRFAKRFQRDKCT